MGDRSYLDNEVADSAAIRFAEKLLKRWYLFKKKKKIRALLFFES